MTIIKSLATNNPCYKAGRKIKVKGLMLHSVGCPQPSATVFFNQCNKASYSRACVHAFIDGNTGFVHQLLPWNYRGWHSGSGTKGSANNSHIGVEMCEPSTIKYTSGSRFTCSDLDNAREVAIRTYNSAVEVFASLCKEYSLDPVAHGVIISHKEGYSKGIASNHGDPDHLWKGLNLPYTMDTFRRDVKNAMYNTPISTPVTESADKSTTNNATIKVGSVVKVQPGAKTYTGGGLAKFVYNREHVVSNISGERVVITYNGTIIAAVHKKDLILVK